LQQKSFYDVTIDPCNSSGLEEIHRNIQAASSTLSENAQSIPPLLSKASTHVSTASTNVLEQVSSAWTQWMASSSPSPGGNNATKGQSNNATTTVTKTSITKDKEGEHRHPQQPLDLDLESLDSSSSSSSIMPPVRDIIVDPNDQGSLCFKDDEIGSAINDAILAQYLEHPYINGERAQVNLWDGSRRSRSRTRGLWSFQPLSSSRASSREAERERKKNKQLARSLSRERSRASSTKKSVRTNEDDVDDEQRQLENPSREEHYLGAVSGDSRESANILVHHY
jgi:hypothetical protein